MIIKLPFVTIMIFQFIIACFITNNGTTIIRLIVSRIRIPYNMWASIKLLEGWLWIQILAC